MVYTERLGWGDESDSREDLLKKRHQRLFNESMPCKDCKLNDICKYTNSVECFSYDKDVFEVEIKCKKMIK